MSIQYICSTLATIESGNRETTIEYLYKVQATKDYMVYTVQWIGTAAYSQVFTLHSSYLAVHCTGYYRHSCISQVYRRGVLYSTAATARCTDEVY